MSFMQSFLIKKELEKKGLDLNAESVLSIITEPDTFSEILENLNFKTDTELMAFEKDLFHLVIELSLEKIKKESNQETLEDLYVEFKNNLNVLKQEYKRTFNREIKELKITEEERNIIIDIIKQDDTVLEYFNDNILNNLVLKESNNDFIKSVNEIFFNEKIHDFLFKKENKNKLKEYEDFFTYFVNEFNPSSKTEGFSKLYAYCISGNMFNDFINNHNDIQSLYKSNKMYPTNKTKEEMKEKIKNRCMELHIPLKLENMPNVEGNYNKYINESPTTLNFSKTQSSYFDYVIKDQREEKKYLLFRTTANYQEQDIYNHDEKRIAEDFAIIEYSKANNIQIEVFDVYKSHNKKELYKIDFINEENIEEIKEIFDTSINISVSTYTGLYSNLVFLGDKEYSKEYLKEKDYYELAKKVLSTMVENGNNKNIKNLTVNVLKWLDKNISIENDIDNRKYLQKEIQPLLLEIFKKYSYDNEVKNSVLSVNNTLGSLNPNRSYALSLIQKKIEKNKKEESYLKNIKNMNPYQNFSASEKENFEELKDNLIIAFFKYHNILANVEFESRSNSTKLRQLSYCSEFNLKKSLLENTLCNQYREINTYCFTPKYSNYGDYINGWKEDNLFNKNNEQNQHQVHINKSLFDNFKENRNIFPHLDKYNRFEKIIGLVKNFSDTFNIDNIKKEYGKDTFFDYLMDDVEEVQQDFKKIYNDLIKYSETIKNNLDSYRESLEKKLENNKINNEVLSDLECKLHFNTLEISEEELVEIKDIIDSMQENLSDNNKVRKKIKIK